MRPAIQSYPSLGSTPAYFRGNLCFCCDKVWSSAPYFEALRESTNRFLFSLGDNGLSLLFVGVLVLDSSLIKLTLRPRFEEGFLCLSWEVRRKLCEWGESRSLRLVSMATWLRRGEGRWVVWGCEGPSSRASSNEESISGAENETRGPSHLLGVEEKRLRCFSLPCPE